MPFLSSSFTLLYKSPEMLMLRTILLLLVATAAHGYSLSSSFSRRGFAGVVVSTGSAAFVSPAFAAADSRSVEGRYSDPNHPKGYRQVRVDANTLIIDGSDR